MQKKQVAVLDVGSSKITALVGERGINDTFVIKGKTVFEYDGFLDGEFLDVEGLNKILKSSVDFFKSVLKGNVNTVYVGVPSAFTTVFVKKSQVSFPSKKKITEEDVDLLFDGAFVTPSASKTLINRSAIIYELDDFRYVAYPVGSQSGSLKGQLSFVVCDNYFIENVSNVLLKYGVLSVECTSSSLAQARYLLDEEVRDRIALLVDIGHITTTYSVVQGDGILYEKTIPFGGGYLTASIAEKYDMDFSVAEKLKRSVNLSSLTGSSVDLIEADNGEYYSVEEIKSVIKGSLTGLCESIDECQKQSGFALPEYVKLSITGGGITSLRGAKEYVSGLLGMAVEVVGPQVPMMNKPTESSVLSLLNIALEQK